MRTQRSRAGRVPSCTRGALMPVRRRQLLIAAAGLPWLASCATDLSASSQQPLPELAARWGVCAASVVTLRAGKVASAERISGCTPAPYLDSDAVFQAASLTKPVVAYLALQLVREGRLDLQAPVSQYLPRGYLHRQRPFGGPGARQSDLVPASTLARIPVATLLNHSAGLPNWTGGVLSLQFEPGSRWQYSGEAYVLLQSVISAAVGQDWAVAMAQRVFEPLGMRHSWLHAPQGLGARLLQGTSSGGGVEHFDFKEPNAAASLYTTAADYARLMAAWWSDVALRQLASSRTVPVDPALGLAWGLGWGLETAAGGPYFWQWGNNPGFRGFAMMSAASGNGFVLLTNSARGLYLAASAARAAVPAEHPVFRFHMLA